jgi:hypothetical protein
VGRVLVVAMAFVLVNLPLTHQVLTDREVARSGTEVEAAVLVTETVEGRHLVAYRLPASVGPGSRRFSTQVDRATFERAREARALVVRVVPGDPAAHRVVGEVRSRLFLVAAVVGDVLLLGALALWWHRRRRTEDEDQRLPEP